MGNTISNVIDSVGYNWKGWDIIVSRAILPSIFTFAGILLLLYLLYGGFQLMVAGGDPKKMETGKSIITNAIIGFIIIFVSYWLVRLIGLVLGLPQIIGTFGTSPPGSGPVPAN